MSEDSDSVFDFEGLESIDTPSNRVDFYTARERFRTNRVPLTLIKMELHDDELGAPDSEISSDTTAPRPDLRTPPPRQRVSQKWLDDAQTVEDNEPETQNMQTNILMATTEIISNENVAKEILTQKSEIVSVLGRRTMHVRSLCCCAECDENHLTDAREKNLLRIYQNTMHGFLKSALWNVRGWYYALMRDLVRDHTVLDIGSGFGYDSIYFATNGAHVVSVDISVHFAHIVSAIATQLSLSHRIETLTLDNLSNMRRVPTESIDILWMNAALHVYSDTALRFFMDEWLRALKPGGFCFIVSPNQRAHPPPSQPLTQDRLEKIGIRLQFLFARDFGLGNVFTFTGLAKIVYDT